MNSGKELDLKKLILYFNYDQIRIFRIPDPYIYGVN